jgi:SP family myo-inositol transporter-like MFS transporter 13
VADYPYDKSLVGSALGTIILFVVGFGSFYGYICWYQSEFLPLEIRAAGSAIAVSACWIANLVVSVAYLTQLESLGASPELCFRVLLLAGDKFVPRHA